MKTFKIVKKIYSLKINYYKNKLSFFFFKKWIYFFFKSTFFLKIKVFLKTIKYIINWDYAFKAIRFLRIEYSYRW
jgi:hypothetical protein